MVEQPQTLFENEETNVFYIPRLSGNATLALRGTSLVEAIMSFRRATGGLILEDLDFSGLDLTGLRLRGYRIRNCRFNNVTWNEGGLINCVLENVIIERSVLHRPRGAYAFFHYCQLKGVMARETEFSGHCFGNVEAEGSEFAACRFNKVSFSMCAFGGLFLHDGLPLVIRIDSEYLSGRIVWRKPVSFKGSRFEDCRIERSLLANCDFESTEWLRSTIRGSGIENSSFRGASFRDTYFCPRICRNMSVEGTDLRGLKFHTQRRFPFAAPGALRRDKKTLLSYSPSWLLYRFFDALPFFAPPEKLGRNFDGTAVRDRFYS